MALVVVAVGLMLLILPIRRSKEKNPAPQAQGASVAVPHAGSPQVPQVPDARSGAGDHTGVRGGEMVYDIWLNPVKDILVHYIYGSADISMIASQAGLDLGSGMPPAMSTFE